MKLNNVIIGIKGAGEMAGAVAWRLHMANMRRIFMMDLARPLAIRRKVTFSEALFKGHHVVEGVAAIKAEAPADIDHAWSRGKIAVLADPEWKAVARVRPDVVVDAILAKKNLGTAMDDAPLVIALGPGFTAGRDAHFVIETHRGHHLGRIITSGAAAPNTGVPGDIGGFTSERVFRAPVGGIFRASCHIGDSVKTGEILGTVDGNAIYARIDGVVRGVLVSETPVPRGMKLGDIDPRNDAGYCHTISDKSRAIAGSVLEAILRKFNT